LKKLEEIIKNVNIITINGDKNIPVASVSFDSRKTGQDALFVAIPGTQTNGHEFIGDAIKNGAKVVVCETMPLQQNNNITYILTDDAKHALAAMACAFFDHPSTKIKLIGVTGTNGKTSIVNMLYQLFNNNNIAVGMLSTINNYVNKTKTEATHTTSDPVMINHLLNEMVKANCKYCFMEVSSHAIHQKRVEGLNWTGGIFTNITHDHLDYHKTFDEYLNVKKLLFDDLPPEAFALVNIDDPRGKIMVQNTKAQVKTYAVKSMADFKTKITEHGFDGMQLEIDKNEIYTHFIGRFNAYNMLAVYSTAILLGLQKEIVLKNLSALSFVNGRLEKISAGKEIHAFVDYAHTPDALKNVFESLKEIKNKKNKLIAVVGAGGNRDKEKRPLMAKISVQHCDVVILTSDNPRDENPEDIINDMMKGIENKKNSNVLNITNRVEAIKTAIMMAGKNDVVLVAGKGHETYQEIKGVKHHFDDKEILNTILSMN
jgi:UDP-N-acetylmuramoyl-L-alanyl-D-glutamate--2,6-diaminopimelate ligase